MEGREVIGPKADTPRAPFSRRFLYSNGRTDSEHSGIAGKRVCARKGSGPFRSRVAVPLARGLRLTARGALRIGRCRRSLPQWFGLQVASFIRPFDVLCCSFLTPTDLLFVTAPSFSACLVSRDVRTGPFSFVECPRSFSFLPSSDISCCRSSPPLTL